MTPLRSSFATLQIVTLLATSILPAYAEELASDAPPAVEMAAPADASLMSDASTSSVEPVVDPNAMPSDTAAGTSDAEMIGDTPSTDVMIEGDTTTAAIVPEAADDSLASLETSTDASSSIIETIADAIADMTTDEPVPELTDDALVIPPEMLLLTDGTLTPVPLAPDEQLVLVSPEDETLRVVFPPETMLVEVGGTSVVEVSGNVSEETPSVIVEEEVIATPTDVASDEEVADAAPVATNENNENEELVLSEADTSNAADEIATNEANGEDSTAVEDTTNIDDVTPIDTLAWDGEVAAPHAVDVGTILTAPLVVGDQPVTAETTRALIKVGASEPGVSLTFSQPVGVEVPVGDGAHVVRVLTSEDGVTWSVLADDVPVVDGRVSFETTHFSFFLVTDVTSWTRTKAEHLARRALLDPTSADIDRLLAAGSATAAVDLLFTAPTVEETAQYEAELAAFATRNAANLASSTYMENLYTFRLMRDPARAKRKLWLVWEDTFSVNGPDSSKATALTDVDALHQFLYDNALGDYKAMVNGMLTNYAMGKFLDLLNANKNAPNENFARELLQLFLMDVYAPRAAADAPRNYEEADVAALAKILTGYGHAPGSTTVTYDAANHNTTPQIFLGQPKTDPATIVSYIFEQRATEISKFIAAKLLRFYVRDDYTPAELDLVASELRANNFAIEPTVKSLLVSETMYTTAALTSVRYKNQPELIAGLYRLLYATQPTVAPDAQSGVLRTLGFQPYFPGSIFGRAGMEDNSAWFNAYTTNKWLSTAMRIASNRAVTPTSWTPVDLVPWLASAETAAGKTPSDLITALEDALLLGRRLPESVKTQLVTYLTTDAAGAPATFAPTNATYQNNRVRGVIGLILSQPEFLLQSGYDQSLASASTATSASPYASRPNLVFVKLNGGMDWQGLVAPISDPSYATFRGSLAFQPDERVDLGGGYALNKSAEALMPYYTSGELTFLNGVGLVPGHSRAHDTALTQMETGGLMTTGAVGRFFADQSASSTDLVALYNGKPDLFRGAPSISIGGDTVQLQNTAQGSATERTSQFNALRAIVAARTFPSSVGSNFASATRLDTIATQSAASGGTTSAGYNNAANFQFLSSMLSNGMGKVFYTLGNGGYDTHGDQETQYNTRVGTLATDIAAFYAREKAAGRKLTIVVYSEFGRTNRINGSAGTDHGTGGGMIVLSNEVDYPGIVGTLAPSRDRNDWLSTRIDVRAVWATLLGAHFGATPEQLFGTHATLSNYLSEVAPAARRLVLAALTTTTAAFTFGVTDTDFDAIEGGASAVLSFGTDAANLSRTGTTTKLADGRYRIALAGLTADTLYHYSLQLTDNNFTAAAPITGTFRTPVARTNAAGGVVNASETKNIVIAGVNQNVNGEMTLGTPLRLTPALTASEIAGDATSLRVRIPADVTIARLTNTTGTSVNWRGAFLAPELLSRATFFDANEAITAGDFTTSSARAVGLVRVGADTPGVSLGLSAPVTIDVPVTTTPAGGKVNILSSEDGVTWVVHARDVAVSGGVASFDTTHFTYFLAVDPTPPDTDDDDDDAPTDASGGGTSTEVLYPNARSVITLNTLATKTALSVDRPVSLAAVGGWLRRTLLVWSDTEQHTLTLAAGTRITTPVGDDFTGDLVVPRTLAAIELPATFDCRASVVVAVRTSTPTGAVLLLDQPAQVALQLPIGTDTSGLGAYLLGDDRTTITSVTAVFDGVRSIARISTLRLGDVIIAPTAELAACAGEGAMLANDAPSLNRATAAAILMRTFGIPTSDDVVLADVSADSWYATAASAAAAYGVMHAPEGRFDPANGVTRASALAMVLRAARLPMPSSAGSTYADIPDDSWVAPYVEFAQAYSLIPLRRYFDPEHTMTRAEFDLLVMQVSHLRTYFDEDELLEWSLITPEAKKSIVRRLAPVFHVKLASRGAAD